MGQLVEQPLHYQHIIHVLSLYELLGRTLAYMDDQTTHICVSIHVS